MEYLTGPEKQRLRMGNRIHAVKRIQIAQKAQDAEDIAKLGAVVTRMAVAPVVNPFIYTDRIVEHLTGVSLSGIAVSTTITTLAKHYRGRRALGNLFRRS